MRNFIYKRGFPQVPEDGLGGVGNTSVQGAANSVYSTGTSVIICEQLSCLISIAETYRKRRKQIWEGTTYSSTGRCFQVVAGMNHLIPGATTQLYVRNSFDFSLFQ